MKIQIATAVLIGLLSFIPASPALAADNTVNTSAPASALVTRLNSRDLMIQGVSDIAKVQLHFTGAERLDAGSAGDLFVTRHGTRQHYRPDAYQIVNGKERRLTVSYTLKSIDLVTVNFGDFDPNAPIYFRGGASTL